MDKHFRLKLSMLADPNIYLGSRVRLMLLPNGVMAWSSIPSKYVQEAVKNVETYVKNIIGERCNIPKTAVNPFSIGYEPTEDLEHQLNPELASYYQFIIGVLRWMIKLGRIDTHTEILMLASHLVSSR